jgi:hypothetical protein
MVSQVAYLAQRVPLFAFSADHLESLSAFNLTKYLSSRLNGSH